MTLEEVQGKTGKSVPFFLDIRQLVEQEQEVRRTGKERTVPCSVIREGAIHQVRLTGIPFFSGNETAGILCLITDTADLDLARAETILDPATGLLDLCGVFAAGAKFDDALRTSRTDYCILSLAPRGLKQLSAQYGASFLEHLEEILAGTLRKADLSGWRWAASRFAALS